MNLSDTQDISDSVALTAPQTTLAEEQLLERLLARFASVEGLTSHVRRLCLDIEDVLNAQLNEIIEAPKFCDMEARWMGLASVVWSKDSTPAIKIKLLDLNWDELSRDLHYTSEIRRAVLYNLLGQRELDTLGGEPFGIAYIDHGLSMSLDTEYDDLFTAQLICSLGEACMCPIVMGVGEDFFGENDAAWFTDARRISNVLNGEEYRGWQTLRELPNARFLGLVINQTQLRGAYEDLDIGFRFHQWPSQSRGLWASAGYDFLRSVIAEYRRSAWFGFLKLVTNEPGVGAVLETPDHPIPMACLRHHMPMVRMTRNLAQHYSESGFIALAESTKNNLLYFVGNRTVTDCKGSGHAEVVTQLQSVLIACRIVHFVKVQIRALIGQVKTAAECEAILNNWFDPYVSPSSSSTELQARYPLQRARIQVSESPSDSARFKCEVVIRPQYQIDEVMGDIVLHTDIGSGKLGEAA
ncbi:type VI secretion system contractile sheath domain-containing protein [Epibacterium ulvae]|uniref:type VI secretion system contractile sheath domain-containing protein n=1 Tax=Epibacterium ulvae TaxID=1156985 RepID=UPI0024908D99|nr:type VI secretion system contractile sheath large subunit [Epibacterium ulvae]